MRPVPQAALALVKASEGMRVRRNLDPAGHSQIGYGHKLTPDSPLWDATLTLTSATLLALDDLDHVAQELLSALGADRVLGLSEGQWSALLDFTFNEGIGRFEGSTLCAKIKAGQLHDAAAEFGRWIYGEDPHTGEKVVMQGLVTRRAAETALWLS